ncbi:hypothetical protein EV175_001408 [Coemansia sp. RSA 1933]|nr:hypothetical protein EV175_001408 [Coemansia sp. RSA 1933]
MDDDQEANRTFAIVKPDALTPFKYQQIDALIKLNEFSIARQKLVWLSEELADALFPDKASDSDRQEWLDYITGAPSLALELEKVNAPLFWQITMGAEDPSEAATNDTDSIRGILAVDRIRNAVDGSQEPEDAVRDLDLVFSEKVPALPYDNFLMERAEDAHSTLAILKPDVAGDEANVSQIIRRIVARGYVIKDRIDITLSRKQVQDLYAEHSDTPYFDGLVEFMTSGPIIVLSLDGDDVIRGWRMMIGPTDPDVARAEAPQSIRALFGSNCPRNAAHGSDSPEAAQRELTFFFFPRIRPEEDSAKIDEETPAIPAESSATNGTIAPNGDAAAEAISTDNTEATGAAEPEASRPSTVEKKTKKQKKRRSKRKQTGTSDYAGTAVDQPSLVSEAAHASDRSDGEKTPEPASQEPPLSQTENVELEYPVEEQPMSQAAVEEDVTDEASPAIDDGSNAVVELAVAADPAKERTFGLIKPDAYPRYQKQILTHIAEKGLVVVAQEEVVLTRDAAGRIYDGMKEFPVFPRVIDFVTSGPVLALVLEGHDAVSSWRCLVGPNHPRTARLEDRNSLRAKYGQDAQTNAVHASKDMQEVQCSIKAVFYDLLGGEFSTIKSTDNALAAGAVVDDSTEKADADATGETNGSLGPEKPVEQIADQTIEKPSDEPTAPPAQIDVAETEAAASNGNTAKEQLTVDAEAPVVEEQPPVDKMESLSVADVEPKPSEKPESNGVADVEVKNEDSVNGNDSKDESSKSLAASPPISPQNRTTPTFDKSSTLGNRLASSPFLKADRQLASEPAAGAKRVGRIQSPFLANKRVEPGVAPSPSSTASKSVHSSPLTGGASINMAAEDKPKVDNVAAGDGTKADVVVRDKMAGLGIDVVSETIEPVTRSSLSDSSTPKNEQAAEPEKVDEPEKLDKAEEAVAIPSKPQEEPIDKSTSNGQPPKATASAQAQKKPTSSSISGDKTKAVQPPKSAKGAAAKTPPSSASHYAWRIVAVIGNHTCDCSANKDHKDHSDYTRRCDKASSADRQTPAIDISGSFSAKCQANRIQRIGLVVGESIAIGARSSNSAAQSCCALIFDEGCNNDCATASSNGNSGSGNSSTSPRASYSQFIWNQECRQQLRSVTSGSSPTKSPGASATQRRTATESAASARTAVSRPTLTRPVGPPMSVVSTASSRARAAKAAEARAAEAKAAETKAAAGAARTTLTRPVTTTRATASSSSARSTTNGPSADSLARRSAAKKDAAAVQ